MKIRDASMKEPQKKLKLWQSMVNTNLTPDEFLKLIELGKLREQSIRELVSTILRQEIKAFEDLITESYRGEVLYNALSLGACAPRRVGRPRLKDARTFTKVVKEKELPISLEELINQNEEKS